MWVSWRRTSSRVTGSKAQGSSIGVVTSIVSISQFRIIFDGVQNHAGTTRMAIRRDAGVAAVNFCHEIQQVFREHAGEHTVWTTGRITLDPGAPSIIPGRAEVLFQFRDADPAKLVELEAVLHETVAKPSAGPCAARLETISKSIPALMDSKIQTAIEKAAARHAPGRACGCQVVRVTMPRSSRGTCPPECCLCRASAASRTTGRRILRMRTS